MVEQKSKLFITPEQAISLLAEGEYIHTFRANRVLIGADRTREEVINLFNDYPKSIQIGGNQCVLLGHGIVVEDITGYLFISHDKQKLIDFEKSVSND